MMERTRHLLAAHTEHAVRNRYGQVIHGVRTERTKRVTVRDRHDALRLVYPDAVLAGWSAAGLHGVRYAAGHPPEIWLPVQRRRKGVVIRTGHLPAADIATVLGRRATTAVRTAVDLARHEGGDRAIAALDQCVWENEFGRSATTLDAVRAYLEAHPELHRGAQARRALAEASTGADSPWETYTRLVVHRSGLRLFRPQTPVPGTGLHVDLGSREFRIAIEYEGDYHRDSKQHKRDIVRWNRIRDQDWEIVLVTASLLTGSPGELVGQIARKLAARGWRGPAPSTPKLDL